MEKSTLAQFSQIISLAGVGFIMTLSSPFDLIRFRLQTMPQLIRQGTLQISYKGILDCIRRVRREQGVLAFWKGNLSNLLRVYPSETINFTAKEMIQSSLWFQNSLMPVPIFLKNSASGLVGSWITIIFLYPFDYSRLKQANDISGKSGGIIKTLLKTFQIQGIRGIYRGATISFVGAGLFRAAYFGIFDSFKNHVNRIHERWMVGYLATWVALLVHYPSDTVRRRMMMTNCQDYKYDGFWDCAKQMYRKEGSNSYFSGGRVIFFQSAIGASILFLYDKVARDIRQAKQMN